MDVATRECASLATLQLAGEPQQVRGNVVITAARAPRKGAAAGAQKSRGARVIATEFKLQRRRSRLPNAGSDGAAALIYTMAGRLQNGR